MVKVIAIVVLFHCDSSELIKLLDVVNGQVDSTVLVDNGADEFKYNDIKKRADCLYISNDHNLGIAAAQNIGIEYARKYGATHILLLDQDSLPEEDMVSQQLELERLLLEKGTAVGAIGPSFVEEKRGGYSIVDYLIGSGMLVRLQVLEMIGCMKEEFFIDGVDFEWGARASSKGFCLVQSYDARMQHQLGQRKPIFGKKTIVCHLPFRYYYIFRNYIVLCRSHYAPPPLKRYLLVGLFAFAINVFFLSDRRAYFYNIFLGVKDGLLNRTPGYPNVPVRPAPRLGS